MTIPMLVLMSTLVLSTGVMLLISMRLVRALRHTAALESRIGRLQEGLNLLTDTTETGFRQVAAELERLAVSGRPAPVAAVAGAAPSPARPTAARLRTATRQGRTVKDIAAAEQVSEGEVRLRLALAEASAAGRTRPVAVIGESPRPRKTAAASRTRKTTETKRAALRA